MCLSCWTLLTLAKSLPRHTLAPCPAPVAVRQLVKRALAPIVNVSTINANVGLLGGCCPGGDGLQCPCGGAARQRRGPRLRRVERQRRRAVRWRRRAPAHCRLPHARRFCIHEGVVGDLPAAQRLAERRAGRLQAGEWRCSTGRPPSGVTLRVCRRQCSTRLQAAVAVAQPALLCCASSPSCRLH